MDFSSLPPGTRIVDGNLVVPASSGQISIRVKGTSLEQTSPAVSANVPTGVSLITNEGNDLPNKITAGEPLPSFTAIALINWVAYRYDPTNRAHAYAYGGFIENSAMMGDSCLLRQSGVLRFPQGTSLKPGARYLAAPEGRMTDKPGSGDVFTRIIGIAMSPYELILLTQPPVFLL